VFVSQIKLATKTDLPLILHIRPRKRSLDAYEDGLDILSHFQKKTDADLSGTAHFFVGNEDIAKRFLDLGFYISFTGPLTHDTRLQRVCEYVPTDRLLAETDTPFAAPEPHRGQRNSPTFLQEIVTQIAAAKQTPESAVRNQLLANTQKLFSIA
jgi:TatD DNase family protein